MLFSIPSQVGYGALFGLVAGESAGVPLPGETALLGAGLLAGSGHLSLPLVIGIGAGAAIIGDNFGYLIGRSGGRAFLTRGRVLKEHRRKAVVKGEEFFDRHGGKTVFFGRWVTGVRIVAAVLAGATAMPWRKFVVYNALGGIAWATTIAGSAALLGPVGAAVIYGAGLVVAGGGIVAVIGARRRRSSRRRELAASQS